MKKKWLYFTIVEGIRQNIDKFDKKSKKKTRLFEGEIFTYFSKLFFLLLITNPLSVFFL